MEDLGACYEVEIEFRFFQQHVGTRVSVEHELALSIAT